MSFYINFHKRDETKLREALDQSHPALMANHADLRDVFEVDYCFNAADGSVNAASDEFQPDLDALYEGLLRVELTAYGAIEDFVHGWILYALAEGTLRTVNALTNSDCPAVRVNPDGSI